MHTQIVLKFVELLKTVWCTKHTHPHITGRTTICSLLLLPIALRPFQFGLGFLTICSHSTDNFINHTYDWNQYCNFGEAQTMSSLMMVYLNRNMLWLLCSHSTENFINHTYDWNQYCNFGEAQTMSSLMMVYVNRDMLWLLCSHSTENPTNDVYTLTSVL